MQQVGEVLIKNWFVVNQEILNRWFCFNTLKRSANIIISSSISLFFIKYKIQYRTRWNHDNKKVSLKVTLKR